MADILDWDAEILPFFGDECCTPENKLLKSVWRRVESQVRAFVGHNIAQETITGELQRRDDIGCGYDYSLMEFSNGKLYYEQDAGAHGDILQLDSPYVRSITSLFEDPSAVFGQGPTDFGASTELTLGTDFYLELDATGMSKSGRLIRKNRPWSSRPGTIKVTYVAGFTAAELNGKYSFVKQAILEEMQSKYTLAVSQQTNGGGPLKKEIFHGDYTVEYAVGDSSGSKWQLSPGTRSKLEPIRKLSL